MESDDILLSWISEYVYCRRRFYLRYVESIDAASADMVEGRCEHRIVDQKHITKRVAHVVVSRLSVISQKYAVYGICDNVEFDRSTDGTFIPFLNDTYALCPVEFKHGKKRNEMEYEQQLCAQAMCLEEMYHTQIPFGYIYYVDSRERHQTFFDDALRTETIQTIHSIKDDIQKLRENNTPEQLFPARYQRRCPKCAMYDICTPKKLAVEKYMQKLRSVGESND